MIKISTKSKECSACDAYQTERVGKMCRYHEGLSELEKINEHYLMLSQSIQLMLVGSSFDKYIKKDMKELGESIDKFTDSYCDHVESEII
jgi:hypothetical protein